MGAPKKFRKTYERPGFMWEKQRIDEEHKLKERFGLRNLKEVWIAASELRRIRRNVREVLSGRSDEAIGKQIIARLAKYGIVSESATLDDLLIINIDTILNRRLQTVVMNKGLSKTAKQARQLITHGFIAINGRRITSPGYIVPTNEENKIAYYKQIDINPKTVVSATQITAPAAAEGASEAAVEQK
ncbi:MAG: 30S ribosomal protein S4 [Candidatus Micrarchaeota archaeon]|nr:30S ribosomal protein S4 [Candidatus Micrarchaeota archaeon]MDE1804478.1 30S ribosomal protein S4 [Candidatus Micrarchaeota archaeon]MDE1846633.1 30S ribosomal protein S4 [Candidatus Micrarchaeota archaeon]